MPSKKKRVVASDGSFSTEIDRPINGGLIGHETMDLLDECETVGDLKKWLKRLLKGDGYPGAMQ